MEKRYHPKIHVAPPSGWMNDPNGTCLFGGALHVFYQHAEAAEGGLKSWGHAVSRDLLSWEDTGDALLPDTAEDRDGAYSGTAFTGGGELEVFYTGNVKHRGNYDYINEGRGHNVLRASGFDGRRFTKKEVLLTNADYPASLSCHVRDPKVWKGAAGYEMLLGARTRDSRAALLLFESQDGTRWGNARLYVPRAEMGYMFECPDVFRIGGRAALAFCPQGIARSGGEAKFQNAHHSGYVVLPEGADERITSAELDEVITRENFREWDKGFDFYAPQTFRDGPGRLMLIGWAGVPDAPYGNAPSMAEGWQHSMTLIRELSAGEGGEILQNPIREYEKLRGRRTEIGPGSAVSAGRVFDAEVSLGGRGEISLGGGSLKISAADGLLSMRILDETGCGRTERLAEAKAETLRLVFDRSILEVYADGGRAVMTARWYPGDGAVAVETTGRGSLWEMEEGK